MGDTFMNMKLDRRIIKLYIYLVPFLYPRGLWSFPLLKSFFTGWLYVAIVFILIDYLMLLRKKKKMDNKYIVLVVLYHALMLILTLLIRHEFTDSLQKIFAAPVLCILAAMYLENKSKKFVRAVNNILILDFLLSITVFSPLFWPDLFEPVKLQYTFLGHIQTSAQLGVLSMLMAYIEYYFWTRNKNRFIFQIILSILIMITSFTSASYIAIIMLSVFWIINKTRMRKIFEYTGKTYFVAYICLNIFLFWFILSISRSFTIGGFSLNGRGFIWKEAIDAFLKSPIYGYGVHGVLIKTFWSSWIGNGEGMNYMHNQILQVLNDGGVLLLIPYLLILYYLMSRVAKVRSGQLKFWVLAIVFVALIIMTFESSLNYYYMFLLISTTICLPNIEKNNKRMVSPRLKCA